MRHATKLKRTIVGLLCAAMIFSGVACNSESSNDDQNVQNENVQNEDGGNVTVYNLATVKENIGDYTVVRSDASGQEITDATLLIRQSVKQATGIELAVATDWDGDADNSNRLEIRVGNTNRATDVTLDKNSFMITDDEKGNILLLGSDDKQVVKAVESFLAQNFGYQAPENQIAHNVKDYGAVGDGQTDDTEAFKAAVKAAEKDRLPVYVPGGDYLISDTITLNSVTLYGQEQGAWTADDCGLPKIEQKNMYKPLFDVRSGSLAGVNIHATGEAGNTEMQPSVLITGTGGRVSNSRIHQPYIGIFTDDTSNPGRCFIDNIFIIEAKEMGVYVGGTYDVPALNNIEVWNPNETCPVAFKFGHNDDLRAVNCFAFRAKVGFLIEETETGSCWGSFTNCSVDYTSIGFRFSKGAHHATIVGGTYWTHHTAIDVTKNCTGYVAVSGCELKSNGERTLSIQGGNTVTVTGCSIIHDFENNTTPAIAVGGGKAVNISGNTVYSRADAINLTHREEGVIAIVNNTIYTGGKELVDHSKNCVVKVDNIVLEGATFNADNAE